MQTMSPPAGNHGDRAVQEVVGGVDHTHQQKQCRELQQECRKYEFPFLQFFYNLPFFVG